MHTSLRQPPGRGRKYFVRRRRPRTAGAPPPPRPAAPRPSGPSRSRTIASASLVGKGAPALRIPPRLGVAQGLMCAWPLASPRPPHRRRDALQRPCPRADQWPPRHGEHRWPPPHTDLVQAHGPRAHAACKADDHLVRLAGPPPAGRIPCRRLRGVVKGHAAAGSGGGNDAADSSTAGSAGVCVLDADPEGRQNGAFR